MQSKRPRSGEGWQADEADLERHTLIFRLLDLGGALLDLVFDDDKARSDYEAARAANERERAAKPRVANDEDEADDAEDAILPIVSWQFERDHEGEIHVAARTDGEGFLFVAITAEFQATVVLVYDPEEDGLLGGCVLSFEGDMVTATQWAQSLCEAVDAGELALPERD